MGKITPSTKTNSFAPLGRAIAGNQQGLAIATANNTQYLFNQAGNCVYVQGQDISAVPNAIYTNPVTTSTGLSGPGAAVLIGSTWYSFAALTDKTAADIQPVGLVASAGSKGVPADAEHVHAGNSHVLRVHMANAQPVGNNALTLVDFDTVDEDTDSGYSGGTYTVATAGLWIFTAEIGWANNGTGSRGTEIVSSSGKLAYQAVPTQGVAGGYTNTTLIERLAAGATIVVNGIQSSGGSLNTSANATCWLHGALLCP